MISVDMFIKCAECDSLAQLQDIKIDDITEEMYLKKVYRCSCDFEMIAREVIDFNIGDDLFEKEQPRVCR